MSQVLTLVSIELDTEDEHLRQYCTVHSCGYIVLNKDGKQELLHRYLMKCPEGMTVDHRDGRRYNCKKNNLRLATYSQNNYNTGKKIFLNGTSSKYKGVYYVKGAHRHKKWWAYITVVKKRISLGYYQYEEDAAVAYNIGAMIYHGEFAKLNPL